MSLTNTNISIDEIFPKDLPIATSIKNEILEKVKSLNLLSAEFPVYILHKLPEEHVFYMSPIGLKNLNITLEEIRDLGNKYHQLFFNNEEADSYLYQWNEFKANQENLGSWFTFFQQVKQYENNEEKLVWFISLSKVLTLDDYGKPNLSITIALKISEYMPFIAKLDRIVEENKFLKDNLDLFLNLTKKEKLILKLMAQGIKINVIAENIHISEETVRTHRKNIKKKLSIKNDAEIVKIAQAFNLI